MKKIAIALAALALAGCAPAPAPEPSPTLRAPECFDGTVGPGCPSWALDVPKSKKVSHHSTEGDAVYMHFTDGTRKRVK